MFNEEAFFELMQGIRKKRGFEQELWLYTNNYSTMQKYAWDFADIAIQLVRWGTFGYKPPWILPFIPTNSDVQYIIIGTKDTEEYIDIFTWN